MGGFAGGDEAGFWDEKLFKLSKSSNSKKKQTALICIDSLYYTLALKPSKNTSFQIEGLPKNQLTVFIELYKALLKETQDEDIEDFFRMYTLLFEPVHQEQKLLDEDIDNSLTFLSFIQESCSLVLTQQELKEIAKTL